MTGKVYGEISVRDYVRATSSGRMRLSSRRAMAAVIVLCMVLLGYVAGSLLPLGSLGTPAQAREQEPGGDAR